MPAATNYAFSNTAPVVIDPVVPTPEINPIDARIALQKGEPDGLAPLNADGRIDREYLDSAALMSAAGEEMIASLKARYGENAGTFYFSGHGVLGDLVVFTSTGYVRLIQPDGSLGAQQVHGIIAPVQSYSGAVHRAFGAMSVANGGSVRSGDIVEVRTPGRVTFLDIAKLSNLSFVVVWGSRLVSFVADSSKQSVTGWSFIGNQALRKFIPPLGWNGAGYGQSIQLVSCALSAAALDEFFAALGPSPGGKSYIDVQFNPGSSTCDPTIATAKGWLVYT